MHRVHNRFPVSPLYVAADTRSNASYAYAVWAMCNMCIRIDIFYTYCRNGHFALHFPTRYARCDIECIGNFVFVLSLVARMIRWQKAHVEFSRDATTDLTRKRSKKLQSTEIGGDACFIRNPIRSICCIINKNRYRTFIIHNCIHEHLDWNDYAQFLYYIIEYVPNCQTNQFTQYPIIIVKLSS